jgi:hypothetical protein
VRNRDSEAKSRVRGGSKCAIQVPSAQPVRELGKMTTTTEVSDSFERVDSIVNMLDEICDHMDGFSSTEEAWLSSITETLRTWRYVMQETYESAEENKDD